MAQWAGRFSGHTHATRYDEGRELTRYVWTHFTGLMTEAEQRVGWALLFRDKMALTHPPEVADDMARRWAERTGAPDMAVVSAEGPEAFRRRVRDRVLAERGAEVFVNRCPACRRLVRTPTARQCFWCGCDWHDRRPDSEP